MDKKKGGRIKNWRIVDGLVYGDIHNDARFPDGEPIHTSWVQKIEVETKIIVETRNTIYELSPSDQQDQGLSRYAGRKA